MSVIEHECPRCDGIGYRFMVNRVTLPDAVPCALCDGEGKVASAKQLRGAVEERDALREAAQRCGFVLDLDAEGRPQFFYASNGPAVGGQSGA